jgi:hypothetical protein
MRERDGGGGAGTDRDAGRRADRSSDRERDSASRSITEPFPSRCSSISRRLSDDVSTSSNGRCRAPTTTGMYADHEVGRLGWIQGVRSRARSSA